MLSYWEQEYWQRRFDFIVVGGGFTGLNLALCLKDHRPKATVLIVEKTPHFVAASTKNAGFACFGSPSEVLHDLQLMGEEGCAELVRLRREGIAEIARTYGHRGIGYRAVPAHEWFLAHQPELYAQVIDNLHSLNRFMSGCGFAEPVYVPDVKPAYANMPGSVGIVGEGQLNPVLLYHALFDSVMRQPGVRMISGHSATYLRQGELGLDNGMVLRAGLVLNATNAFDSQLTGNQEVKPARAQVLITEPLANLPFDGNYHMDEGYYYFRNVGKRLLLGGARNMDLAGETTCEMALNPVVHERLDQVLQGLLPGREVAIGQRWTGIMGMRADKRPSLEHRDGSLHLTGMSGMGVALAFSLTKQVLSYLP
jgi:glycine/D-amino acid oxidase-like deaminating enzyme